MSEIKFKSIRIHIKPMLFIQLLAILVLCVFMQGHSFAASVNEADNSSPEDIIAEFYRLMSFEAGSRPNYKLIRPLFSDDAIILIGATAAEVELVGTDESIKRIQQKIDKAGFEEFGIRFTPTSIECRVNVTNAYCVTVVEVAYPGLDTKSITSTDLSTLELQEGRWLATSSAVFVDVPTVTAPSILSYPTKPKDATRVTGRKWDRSLPFLAQNAIDLGYDLPKPFGISIIPVAMRQDMSLTGLDISINDRPLTDVDFVDFSTPTSDSNSLLIKLDAWLFPFMNIFGSYGLLEVDTTVPVIVQGTDLMNAIGLGARCDGGALQPEICVRNFNGEATPSFRGNSFTVGGLLATGWEKMFFAMPFSYTWTDIEGKDDRVEATSISPRIGVTGDVGSWGAISTYIGASYLDSTNVVTDTLALDTSGSGVPELGDTTTLNYKIDQENKDKWNYLIGFSWNISRTWSAQAEAGFGGSRSNFISSFTYRY